MSRKFSAREKVLLLILAALLLASGYYLLIFQPTADTIAQADLRRSDTETLIMIEELRAAQMEQMRAELDALAEDPDARVSEIADYDNTQNVVRALNAALNGAESYNLIFNPVAFGGHIASRTIDMSFTCGGWTAAKRIIESLYASPYRCEITALTLLSQESQSVGDLSTDPVSVKLTITFFEYVENPPAESTGK